MGQETVACASLNLDDEVEVAGLATKYMLVKDSVKGTDLMRLWSGRALGGDLYMHKRGPEKPREICLTLQSIAQFQS